MDINLDKDGKMKSNEELAEIYKNVPKNNQVIVYCHRGCRTAYSFYALERLGYKNFRIYEDSWIVYIGARPDTRDRGGNIHEPAAGARPAQGSLRTEDEGRDAGRKT